jgi:hypothetical protein
MPRRVWIIPGLVAAATIAAGSARAWQDVSEEVARLKAVTRATVRSYPVESSRAVAQVGRAYGVEVLDGKDANAQIALMKKEWATVAPIEAQRLANRGGFVVAGRPGKPDGHVAVVVPGALFLDQFPIVAGSAFGYAVEKDAKGRPRTGPDGKPVYRRDDRGQPMPDLAYNIEGQSVTKVWPDSEELEQVEYFTPDPDKSLVQARASLAKAKPELRDLETEKAARKGLAGSWSGVRSLGSLVQYIFNDDGTVSYSTKTRGEVISNSPFRDYRDGRWQLLEGNMVRITFNKDYAEEIGSVRGDRIEGHGRNKEGTQWTWRVDRSDRLPDARAGFATSRDLR